MDFNQTFNDPSGEVIKKPRPGFRSWQVNLVRVRRRDAAHRLTQVYQLLLQWPPTSAELETLTPTSTATTVKVDQP